MKIAVAFCSMTWWASSELIISESKHFVAKGMSLYVQLLKTKGHFVARENSPYVKVVEGHFGKNGAQQLHSIAPSLWIIFVTYRVRVTTSPLKFDGGSIFYHVWDSAQPSSLVWMGWFPETDGAVLRRPRPCWKKSCPGGAWFCLEVA